MDIQEIHDCVGIGQNQLELADLGLDIVTRNRYFVFYQNRYTFMLMECSNLYCEQINGKRICSISHDCLSLLSALESAYCIYKIIEFAYSF